MGKIVVQTDTDVVCKFVDPSGDLEANDPEGLKRRKARMVLLAGEIYTFNVLDRSIPDRTDDAGNLIEPARAVSCIEIFGVLEEKKEKKPKKTE